MATFYFIFIFSVFIFSLFLLSEVNGTEERAMVDLWMMMLSILFNTAIITYF